MTRRRRRLGGPGDWAAPVAALAVVMGMAWAGARLLEGMGWRVPWTGEVTAPVGAGASADGGRRPAPRGDATAGLAEAERRAGDPAVPGGSPSTTAAIDPGPDPVEPPPADPSRDVVTSSAGSESVIAATSADVEVLRARALEVPVQGVARDSLRSDFQDPRAGHAHEAMDIRAPRGQRVLAVEDGTIARLFTSVRGGLTIYQFDPDAEYAYYYAHLDGYAPGLREGATVRRGDPIGYVGTTGNAPKDTPHLHFTIFKLGPERQWWRGAPIDPYLVFR